MGQQNCMCIVAGGRWQVAGSMALGLKVGQDNELSQATSWRGRCTSVVLEAH